MSRALGEFEHLILLAMIRLGDDAYGVTIKDEIETQTDREVYVGAVYTALARMQKSGYVEAELGEPTAKRGGRRKKYYRLTEAGKLTLSQSHEAFRSMRDGIEGELQSLVDGRSS